MLNEKDASLMIEQREQSSMEKLFLLVFKTKMLEHPYTYVIWNV